MVEPVDDVLIEPADAAAGDGAADAFVAVRDVFDGGSALRQLPGRMPQKILTVLPVPVPGLEDVSVRDVRPGADGFIAKVVSMATPIPASAASIWSLPKNA